MTTLPPSMIEKLQSLPPEDLQKVVRFVEALSPPGKPASQHPSLRGRFASLGARVSAEDLAAIRKEAWAHFPRDFTPE